MKPPYIIKLGRYESFELIFAATRRKRGAIRGKARTLPGEVVICCLVLRKQAC